MVRTHEHMRCEEDVRSELNELLLSASKKYLEEVVGKGMQPDCFLELFCLSQTHTGCDLALCRNARLYNLGVVRAVFKSIADSNKHEVSIRECLSKKDCSDLLLFLYGNHPMAHRKDDVPLTFSCKLAEEQLARIVEISHANGIFLVSGKDELHKRLSAVLRCEAGHYLKARNLRKVAVLFDALLANGMIGYDWQSVIEKGRFLVSPKYGKRVTASMLSSSLSKTKRNMAAPYRVIRNEVREIKGKTG